MTALVYSENLEPCFDELRRDGTPIVVRGRETMDDNDRWSASDSVRRNLGSVCEHDDFGG